MDCFLERRERGRHERDQHVDDGVEIYFPRLLIPLSPLIAVFVDFIVALGVLFVLMAAYQQAPTIYALALPLLIAIRSQYIT